MSAFDDALAEITPKAHPCKFGELLGAIPPDSRDSIVATITSGISAKLIGHALKTMGYTISKDTIHRHIFKSCRCE